jgi:lipocalin
MRGEWIEVRAIDQPRMRKTQYATTRLEYLNKKKKTLYGNQCRQPVNRKWGINLLILKFLA